MANLNPNTTIGGYKITEHCEELDAIKMILMKKGIIEDQEEISEMIRAIAVAKKLSDS